MPTRVLLTFGSAVLIVTGCSLRGSHATGLMTDSANPAFPAGSRGLVFSHVVGVMDSTIIRRPTAKGDTVITVARERAQLVTYEGTPAILLAKSSESRGVTFFTDTVVMTRDGFRPIWEHMYSRTRKFIQYAGEHVHQVTYLGDSVVKIVDRESRVPPFAFNQLELLLRSFPYRPGFHVVLPLYSEGDDSVEMDTVTVLGITASPRPQWTVRFADPVITMTTIIDTVTRHVDSQSGAARAAAAKTAPKAP